jgi:hypothetical protein
VKKGRHKSFVLEADLLRHVQPTLFLRHATNRFSFLSISYNRFSPVPRRFFCLLRFLKRINFGTSFWHNWNLHIQSEIIATASWIETETLFAWKWRWVWLSQQWRCFLFFGVTATFAGGREIRIVRLRERSEKSQERKASRFSPRTPTQNFWTSLKRSCISQYKKQQREKQKDWKRKRERDGRRRGEKRKGGG